MRSGIHTRCSERARAARRGLRGSHRGTEARRKADCFAR
ncbi:MAG: hypothetical protein AVDCRST_MAG68-1411 [uncultured Gemmatimonadetes bacterium]|uniref:Uncharacterized protein n=1 Tax=uncultured Gemmatimonadota bacterium TaxID=203437 RepID=A0A6J4KPV8_9BACT|nr:MAG: hypothetical protein AVDCRST_MAG68-1411 [uncultured Gemmatimonadota bacterium]